MSALPELSVGALYDGWFVSSLDGSAERVRFQVTDIRPWHGARSEVCWKPTTGEDKHRWRSSFMPDAGPKSWGLVSWTSVEGDKS